MAPAAGSRSSRERLVAGDSQWLVDVVVHRDGDHRGNRVRVAGRSDGNVRRTRLASGGEAAVPSSSTLDVAVFFAALLSRGPQTGRRTGDGRGSSIGVVRSGGVLGELARAAGRF